MNFCHRLTNFSEGLHLLSWVCQHGPSWGWRQVGYEPLLYLLLCPEQVSSSHRCVYLTRCILKQLRLSENFLRNLFWSWGFPFDCFVSDIFRGGSEVVIGLDDNSHAIWIECSVQSSRKSLFLSPGWNIHTTNCFWRRSCGNIILLWLLYERDSKVFRDTASLLREVSPEDFSLFSIIFMSW